MNTENPYAPPKAPVSDFPEGNADRALASRSQRLGAALLDSIIQSVCIVPLFWVTGIWGMMMHTRGLPAASLLTVGLLSAAVFVIINGYFLKTNGQTLGKRLVGIRIVTLDGEIPPLARTLGLRYGPVWLVSFIPGVGSLAGLIDVLFIFRADHRCVHDHIAGTRVLRAPA